MPHAAMKAAISLATSARDVENWLTISKALGATRQRTCFVAASYHLGGGGEGGGQGGVGEHAGASLRASACAHHCIVKHESRAAPHHVVRIRRVHSFSLVPSTDRSLIAPDVTKGVAEHGEREERIRVVLLPRRDPCCGVALR